MIVAAETAPPVSVRNSEPNVWLLRAMWILWALALFNTLLLVWHGRQFGPGATGGDAVVLRSEYARVMGYTLTKWSLIYLAVLAGVLLAALYAWQLSLAPPLSLMLPVVSAVGVVAAVWTIYVMAFVLKAISYGCLTLSAVNVSFFVVALAYAHQDWRYRQFIRFQSGIPPLPSTPVAMHVLAAILICTSQVLLLGTMHDPPRPVAPPPPPLDHALAVYPLGGQSLRLQGPSQEDSSTDASSGVIWTTKGTQSSPNCLVAFLCLTDPNSRRLHALLNEAVARHRGNLRIDYRFVPQWHACNDLIPRGASEPRSKDACALARCALAVALLRPEAFADYLDWLFKNQDTMSEALARNEAIRLLGERPFLEARDDPRVWRRFREDLEQARRLSLHGVPQLHVEPEVRRSGGWVHGGVSPRSFEAMLSSEFRGSPNSSVDDGDRQPWLIAENLIQRRAQRGEEMVQLRRYQQAAAEWREAVRLNPRASDVCVRLAWLLATCADPAVRNGEDALAFARQAERTAERPTPLLYDALGAALAETGDYDDAVAAARKAESLYKEAGSTQQAQEVHQRLEQYLRGKPHTEQL